MPKENKPRRNPKVKANSLMDEWLAGKNHKFSGGQVVSSKSNDNYIGVIQFPLARLETYRVKWHVGPNPWDYIDGETTCSNIVSRLELSNPLAYKWSQRVPGPSSIEIDRLEAAFSTIRKEKTAKEVDAYIASLEEDLHKKKAIEKAIDETKVDSIVDATLEEDNDLPIDNDGITKKILTILDGE